ncbi:hypothetical protein [Serratia entomophila]|uniref:hypothetical protein n=1 Tax=Serratia entomophila TaxID=42906 RepID=UPI0021790C60|nr:hypothetical protein [Serratia entomophila]CAI1745165.1 Uncharacterised protein [Serratia entomophila]
MVQRYNPDYAMTAAHFEPFAREAVHGEYVKFTDYEALKAERDAQLKRADALAVENCIQDFIITAVKDLARDSEGVIGWHLNGDVASWDEVLPELSHSETPATSAALAAIQAQGVEKYAAGLDQIASESNSAEPKHAIASSYADDARAFAKKLREAK